MSTFEEEAGAHLASVDHDKSDDWVAGFIAAITWAREHDAKVRAEERERAARIAENLYFGGGATGSANRWGAKQAADRIREQGKEQGND